MSSQRGASRLIAILVVTGMVVLLVVAYLGTAVVVSANEKKDADGAIESTLSHQRQVDESFNDPKLGKSFGATDFDPKKTKADIKTYLTKLSEAEARIKSDESNLRTQDDHLKKQSVLTLPRRSDLDHERMRVEAAVGGLEDGRKAINIFQNQFNYFDALVDVLAQFDSLNALLNNKDTAGALNLYPDLERRMQKAIDLSKGPNIPPQFVTLTSAVKTLLDDIKGLLQAIQTNDRSTGQTYINKLDGDVKALQNFDEAGFNAYESKLIDPLQNGYKSGLSKAQSG